MHKPSHAWAAPTAVQACVRPPRLSYPGQPYWDTHISLWKTYPLPDPPGPLMGKVVLEFSPFTQRVRSKVERCPDSRLLTTAFYDM